MIAELGQVALLLALGAALVQATLPLAGAARARDDWMALGRSAADAQALLVVLAFALLAASFVRHDFSIAYVAQNSNRLLPLPYRIAAVWGGHEGSMLLWLLMLQGWTLAVSRLGRALPAPVLARILAVMGMLSVGFLVFLLVTSNPFDRLWPVPPDGRDLNPLLQDPGMVFHPPLLYMGYVGFSVAFAFAVAALIGGDLDHRWARWTRPWTTAAWCFLTLGIALGSAWAYYELGWGGWWFWDPVENASFMPWLVGTALIHSLAVTEKRGAFKSWTVLLAILGFSLSLLGTFLVRSGVLSSVHAFATDPRRGLFILGFLALVVGASLALYAWRAPRIGLGARFGLVSKESMLLANNVMLVAAMASVLLGTLYPLALDALGLGKISVGPPYFDTVFVPVMLPLLLLLGIGPLAAWKQASWRQLARPLAWCAGLAIGAGVTIAALGGRLASLTTVGLVVALWIVATTVADFARWLAPGAAGSRLARLRSLPRASAGMMLAHLGVAAFVLGVTVVRSHEVERDLRMGVGDHAELDGLRFTLAALRDVPGPNYDAVRGEVTVERDGRVIARLAPEKRVYRVQRNPMTEAAIAPGLLRDLYVSLGEPVDDRTWIVRLYVKPFIDWIWGGCVLMALGGALAASDRRYRAKNAAKAGVVDAATAAAAGAAAEMTAVAASPATTAGPPSAAHPQEAAA
ncbi:heme lyase CcmF/NrfE family subunit [Aquabacterium humicola]|uniref:heme lyase CcmF/NrfE family subunit n=1 Tax=Aquabacterium humicola TaxID=3237377 RepID=UPI002543A417|nr:heme lyase CcmF/NrfE family subunit [Rubrivivax pictus]